MDELSIFDNGDNWEVHPNDRTGYGYGATRHEAILDYCNSLEKRANEIRTKVFWEIAERNGPVL